MKNENIIIKTNIHIQQICLIGFAIRRMHRCNISTCINTLNLKIEVYFSQNDFVSRP